MPSKIEWLARPGTKPEVWNPVTGCTKVSEGCRHCYAETMAARFWPTTQSPVVGKDGKLRPRVFADVQAHEYRLDDPLRWRLPRTVFVNSMSDLFHPDVPDAFIDRVFAVMALSPRHTFIVLTKRPERMRQYFADPARKWTAVVVAEAEKAWIHGVWPVRVSDALMDFSVPLENVWLGVSIEDQWTADECIPILLHTPAAVRFVSAEPLLGPVDLLEPWLTAPGECIYPGGKPTRGLDWVIVGGESGPKARPCDVAWVRDIVEQCGAVDVPCFVKQLGARAIDTDGDMHGRYSAGGIKHDFPKLVSRKGGDPSEWPADLRVRQWPEVAK